MSLVYGPDAFTVGADVVLSTYNAVWTKLVNGSAPELTIIAASDDLRKPTPDSGNSSSSVYNGTLSTEQTIYSDIFSGATSCFAALYARKGTTHSSAGYLAQWDSGGTIILYRVTAGPTFTTIATNGTVAINTTYLNCFIKVSGVGATVTINYGDDTNGAFTFGDTDAARILTGKVGFDTFDGGATGSMAFDNVRVYDDSLGGHGVLLAGQRNRSIV